jgi:hypothetical protein
MDKEEISDKISKIMTQLSDIPIINNGIYKSKEGRYIINELRIKTIKPVNYYNKIIENIEPEFPYGLDKKEGGGDDTSY